MTPRFCRLGFICALLIASSAAAAEPTIDWTAAYNGPDSYWDSVGDIALQGGCLHVVGFSYVDYQREIVTLKYAADGAELWSRIYRPYVGPNQPGEGHGIAVDGSGNVYVTGWTAQDSVTNYVDVSTLKYDPDGDLLWSRRFRVPGNNAQGEAVALDPRGFLYVAGAAWVGGGFDALLLKYDLEGNLLWSRTHGHPGSLWDAVFKVRLDVDGNIVMGGYTEPTTVNDNDLYVLKYRSDGQLLLDWHLFSPANDDQVKDLEVDGAGNIDLVGRFYTHFTAIKLDSSGSLVWQDNFAGGGAAGETPTGIRLAPDGSVFAATTSWVSASSIAMVLFKYTPDGARVWTRQEDGGYADASCEDLALDPHGDAYLSGYGFNENGHEDYVTARYDGAGNRVWVSAWSAPEGGSDYAYRLRVGDDLRVFVVGDSWRGLARYYDIQSVVYRQEDQTSVAAGSSGPRLIVPSPVLEGSLITVTGAGADPVLVLGVDGRRLLRLGIGRPGAPGGSVSFRAGPPGIYLVRAQGRTEKMVVLDR